jgi:hypothetical protein
LQGQCQPAEHQRKAGVTQRLEAGGKGTFNSQHSTPTLQGGPSTTNIHPASWMRQ